MFTRILLLASLLIAKNAASDTLKLDKERTVEISGPIAGGVIQQANQIYSLARTSSAPIYLFINSPGGSVHAGLQVMSAMRAARARGVEFRCVTTLMSASMAFQIYAYCDKRYALEHTLLLWHPMKINTQAPISADDADYIAEQIKALEANLNEMLIKVLGISREVFYRHYSKESLWTASVLLTISPNFLTIVDDVDGVEELFPVGG